MQAKSTYPVQFSVDYPESSNRLKVLVRIILAVPILVVATFISGAFMTGNSDFDESLVPLLAGGGLFIAPLLMIVFRGKYPRWWFDWNLELSRFSARITAYVGLMRDEYPSTDEQQSVSLRIEYPDVKSELNRFLPIIKWLLVMPNLIVWMILAVVALFFTVMAWVSILIVGRYPKSLFTFVEGTIRWGYRIGAYAFILTTDRYPPFRLGP